jgi:predicted nucleic acid-binding protein
MTGLVFVDTNPLTYSRDPANPAKQAVAGLWIETLWRERTGRTSVQVLEEFYVTLTRKLKPGLDAFTAREDVSGLFAWDPVMMDGTLLTEAWRVEDRFRLSWWDSLIVAAAHRAQCPYLLTEDLQHGQDLGGTVVVNPFRSVPGDLA